MKFRGYAMLKAIRIKRTRVWVFILFFGVGIAWLLSVYLYPFLAKTARVSSQVLVVEGWSRPFALQSAAVELHRKRYQLLITTGGPVLKSGYLLFFNSSLNFNIPPAMLPKPALLQQSTIRVLARGSAVEGKYAHFTLSVNDSVVAGRYTLENPRAYSFKIPMASQAIQRISIAFDNDTIIQDNDRNLIIYSVSVNGMILKTSSPVANHSYQEEGRQIIEPVYHTQAETSQVEIRKLGLPHIRTVAVPTPYVDIDRTYESAVAARKWLEIHQPAVTSFNVLTEGVHARRSWMMYKKAFGPRYSIGIIAVDYPDLHSGNWWRSWQGIALVMNQLAKYLYAQFYFVPFA